MIKNERVAVITGAASGIGLELAKVCIRKQMHVVMADNNAALLKEKADELDRNASTDVLGVRCDVTKLNDVRELASQTIERFNRVDLLINNAGISGHFAPIWELNIEHVRHVLDVNLHGVIHGVQAFLPYMFTQKHRTHLVNMASMYGLLSGSQISAYTMSKHAIVALTESLYFDLQRLNKPVDVSVACPSFMNTSLLKNSFPDSTDKLQQRVMSLIEHSRPAEDVAAFIMQEVDNKTFYILPDKEVKDYCDQRTKAIIEQADPHIHNIEKIMAALSKRTR